MAEYIDRNALMQAIGEFFEPVNTVQQSLSLNYTLKAIRLLPAADVVEVVRCKDCVYYDFEKGCPFRESGYFCDGKPLPHENDFCSYSERRDNND